MLIGVLPSVSIRSPFWSANVKIRTAWPRALNDCAKICTDFSPPPLMSGGYAEQAIKILRKAYDDIGWGLPGVEFCDRHRYEFVDTMSDVFHVKGLGVPKCALRQCHSPWLVRFNDIAQ